MINETSISLKNAYNMLTQRGINVGSFQYTEVSMPDHMGDRYIQVERDQIINEYDIPSECEAVYCIFIPVGEDDYEPGEPYNEVYSREKPDPEINYDFFFVRIFVKK